MLSARISGGSVSCFAGGGRIIGAVLFAMVFAPWSVGAVASLTVAPVVAGLALFVVTAALGIASFALLLVVGTVVAVFLLLTFVETGQTVLGSQVNVAGCLESSVDVLSRFIFDDSGEYCYLIIGVELTDAA